MLRKRMNVPMTLEQGPERWLPRLYQIAGVALACAGLLALTACFDFADEVHARGEGPVSAEAMAVSNNGKEIAVARVNGEIVTMAMVVDMMNRIAARTNAVAETPEDIEALKNEALEKLITNELAYQQAKAQGITIDEKMINMAIRNLKENLGGEEKYRRFLERERVTEGDLRNRVERSLTLERIFASEVYAKVTVPEAQVRVLYEEQKERYMTADRVTVTDVMFLGDRSDAETGRKAEEILQKIREEKNLDPWKLTQDGTFIVRNLHLDREKQKELYEAAKALQTGELSGVVENNDTLHIMKLKKYVPSRQMSFDEVRAQLENELRVPAQEKRMEDWEKELRTGAKIEIIELQSNGGAEDNKLSFWK